MASSVLALDIGNSAVKALQEGRLFTFADSASAATYEELLRTLAPGAAKIVFASVVPEGERLLRAAHAAAGCGAPLGRLDWAAVKRLVPHSIDDAEMAPGDDRAANVYGLWREGLFPAVCVDAGTGLTAEVLDASGRFVGGIIAPGEALQWRSLTAGTAQLGSLARPAGPCGLLGNTSAGAMASGIRGLLAEGVTGLLRRWEEELLGCPFRRMVFAGGGAEPLYERAKAAFPGAVLERDFTLRSLALGAADARLAEIVRWK